MAGIVIGIVVFLLLLFARQLIHLALLLGVLLVQIFLLLVVDGPYARTQYSLLFGLLLVSSILLHLHVARLA